MELPKEILAAIDEITKNADDIDKAADGLFPFNQYAIDGIFEEKIKPNLSDSQAKYFYSTTIKFKHLWQITKKIEKLDEQYLNFVNFCIEKNEFRPQHYTKATTNSSYFYFLYPFYEAIEFENMLFHGKACLDCFSLAIGSLFKQNTQKLDSLLNALTSLANNNHMASKILNCIKTEETSLRGLTLDPKKEGEKSVRDLISHWQKAPIQFQIYKNKNGEFSTTSGAILDMDHPNISLKSNYLVKNIASNIWYYTLNIISNSFGYIAEQYKNNPPTRI